MGEERERDRFSIYSLLKMRDEDCIVYNESLKIEETSKNCLVHYLETVLESSLRSSCCWKAGEREEFWSSCLDQAVIELGVTVESLDQFPNSTPFLCKHS